MVEIDLLLEEHGLRIKELDERVPVVLLSNAAAATGLADGLLEAGDRALGVVAETNCLLAILIDAIDQNTRWSYGIPRPGEVGDRPWAIFLIGRERIHYFLMASGSTEQYESFISSHLEDLVHDSDIIG